jgi:plasmid stabilization system protein ParE
MSKLVLSAKAERQLENIFEFIEARWSKRVREKAALKIYKNLKIIENNPELFSNSQYNKQLKKCVVSKQTTLFFKYTKSKITIVSVFDTRQNPNKIK